MENHQEFYIKFLKILTFLPDLRSPAIHFITLFITQIRICWNTGETLGVHWVEGNKQLTSSQVEGHQLLVEVLPMLPDKDLNLVRPCPHLAEGVKIFYLETYYDAKNCKNMLLQP